MSTTVDNRIVEMRFDNKQFESNVATSMNTLDKLKEKLNLSGAAKGMENVSRAAGKCDVSGLGAAVDTVRAKFSALDVMAVTALSNITSTAMRAGKRLVESFTIDQVKAGFSEYELKMGSVQTIMNGTGESLDVVMEKLNELNTYADKTIYSFSDMTSNIGKFTNAGVKLNDAVAAIQGVSNLAAVSGANAQQASHAMYNFAQALSSGSVKLIDWKSIENANMATVEFKNELLKTALALGTVKESEGKYITTTTNAKGEVSEAFDAVSKFNESLNHSWMTTEVLTTTLARYSDETTELGKKAFAAAQDVKTFTQLMDTLKEAAGSGWAETWELIIGNFEEAKNLWTDVSKVAGGFIDEQSKMRNNMLKVWKAAGGRTSLINGVKNTFTALQKVVVSVSDALHDIFPRATASNLLDLTKKFQKFSARLIMEKKDLDNLRRTFRGFFAAIDIGLQPLKLLGRMFIDLAKYILPASSGVLELTGSIGDQIVQFDKLIKKSGFLEEKYNALKQAITPFGKSLKYYAGIAKDHVVHLIDWVNQNDVLKIGLERISNGLKEASKYFSFFLDKAKSFPVIGDFFTLLSDKLSEFIDLSDDSKNIFDRILDALKELRSKFSFSDMKDAFLKFVASIKTGGEDAKKALDNLADKLGTSFERIKNFLSDNMGNILAILSGVGLIAAIKMLKDVMNGLKSLGSPIEVFNTVLMKLGKAFDSFAKKEKADAVLRIAIAIGVLALSLKVLSTIDTEKLLVSAGVLAALAGVLLGVAFALSKLSSIDMQGGLFGGGKGLAISMLMIAGSIAILVASLKVMEGLDPSVIGRNIGILAGMFVLVGSFAFILGKWSGPIEGGALTIIGIAIAVKLLVNSLKELCDASDSLDIEAALGSLITISRALGLLVLLSSIAKPSIGAAFAILAAVIALKVVLNCLKELSEIKIEAGAVIGIIAVFTLLTLMLKQASAASASLTGAGVFLIGLAVALLSIVNVIKMLAKIDTGDLIKGGLVVGALMLVMAAVVKASTFAGEHAAKAGVMLLAMSASLVILSVAIAILAGIAKHNPSGLWQAVGAVSILMVVYGIVLAASHLATDATSTVMVIAVTIGILAIALAGLAMIPWQKLLASVAALSIVMLSLSALFIASKFVSKDAIIPVLAMAAVVGLLAIVLNDLAKLPIERSLGASASLSLLILSLSGACLILAGVGTTGGAATAGIITLVELIAVLGTLFAGIGALITLFPQLEEFVNKGIPLVEKLGYGLGSFFGNIVSGFASGATNNLPEIGTILSDFMTNAMPFFDSVQKINPDMAGSFKSLVDGIDALSKLDLSKLTASGNTGSSFKDNMGRLLTDMGDCLIQFSNKMSGFKMDNVDTAVSAITALVEVAKTLPNSGGVLGFFMGNNDWDNFSKGLVGFGEALVGYSGVVSTLTDESVAAIQKSSTAGTYLTELAKSLPNSGGVLGWLAGNNDWDTFSKGLTAFGGALVSYSNIVGPLTDDNVAAIKSSVGAASSLVELSKTLPNSGGVAGFFAGENDWSTFGSGLKDFGQAMVDYSNVVVGIQYEGIESSLNAAQAIVDISSIMGALAKVKTSNLTSFANALSDVMDDGFGFTLKSFGGAIHLFYGSISSIDSGKLTATTTSFNKVLNLTNKAGSLNVTGLKTYGEQLVKFGKALASYANTVSGIDSDSVANKVNSLVNSTPKSNKKIESGINKKELTSSIVNYVSSAANGAKPKVLSAATALTDVFGKGITSGTSKAKKASTVVANAAAKAIDSQKSNFKAAGGHAGDGYVKGIRSKFDEAYQAGYTLGKKAKQGTADAQRSASPSKEFMKLGVYADQGYIKGLLSYTSRVSEAGAGIGHAALDSARGVLSRLAQSISSDFDTEPTIRPVLDLSDITAGAGSISRLLSGNYSFGATGNLDAISASMRENQNGASNDDVVNAIDKLRKDLSGVGNTTYNIDGITYDDGSNISEAIRTLVRAARIERRV